MDTRRMLKAAAQRKAKTKAADAQAAVARDELIRRAIKEGVPRAEIAELAEVSEHRIYQIRRGVRTLAR